MRRYFAVVVLVGGAAVALAGAVWTHRAEPDRAGAPHAVANPQAVRAADWAKGRAEYERTQAARLADVPVSSCDASSAPAGPRICLERLSAQTAPFGSPVRLKLSWTGLPQEASIRVWMDSAAPIGSRFRYFEPGPAAITLSPIDGRGQGEETIEWDGKSHLCAPTDGAMMCDGGEVGRWDIRAGAYVGGDPFRVGFPPRRPEPTRWIVRTQERSVELTGLPRPLSDRSAGGPLPRLVFGAVERAIPRDLLGADVNYRHTLKARFSPWRETAANYCADVELTPPLAGRLSACFPRKRRDRYGVAVREGDVEVVGEPRMAGSLISAAAASAIAVRTVNIASAMPHQVTADFIQGTPPYWFVKVDDPVRVHAGERIGGFEVYVRVEQDGAACRVGTRSSGDPNGRGYEPKDAARPCKR